ncbi:MAG: polysaccharide biosynthesis/export family protein [Caulobacteraceae bacterium]
MALTRRGVLAFGSLAVGAGLTGVGLGACSTTQSIRPRENRAHAFSPWTDAPPPYRLGAGDRVKVDFLLTPELGEETVVGPDGYISLRVAGRVLAQNLSPAQLQAAIAQAASAYLRQPIVNVSVTDAKSARVMVGGSVQKPGVYPLPPRATPMEAVLLAGGFLPEARMDQVIILRPPPGGGGAMLRTVDLRRFVSEGDADDRVALAAEDIVFVPRSRIAELDLWIDENVNKLLPFNRDIGFSYSAGSGVIF